MILLALICISAVIWAICHIINSWANSPDKIIKNRCGFFYDFTKNGAPIHDEHGKKQWADGFTIKTTINGNQNYHFLDVNVNLHILVWAKNLITKQHEWISYTDTLTLSQKGSGSSEFVIQQIAKGGTCYCLTEASTAVVNIVSVKGTVVKKALN